MSKIQDLLHKVVKVSKMRPSAPKIIHLRRIVNEREGRKQISRMLPDGVSFRKPDRPSLEKLMNNTPQYMLISPMGTLRVGRFHVLGTDNLFINPFLLLTAILAVVCLVFPTTWDPTILPLKVIAVMVVWAVCILWLSPDKDWAHSRLGLGLLTLVYFSAFLGLFFTPTICPWWFSLVGMILISMAAYVLPGSLPARITASCGTFFAKLSERIFGPAGASDGYIQHTVWVIFKVIVLGGIAGYMAVSSSFTFSLVRMILLALMAIVIIVWVGTGMYWDEESGENVLFEDQELGQVLDDNVHVPEQGKKATNAWAWLGSGWWRKAEHYFLPLIFLPSLLLLLAAPLSQWKILEIKVAFTAIMTMWGYLNYNGLKVKSQFVFWRIDKFGIHTITIAKGFRPETQSIYFADMTELTALDSSAITAFLGIHNGDVTIDSKGSIPNLPMLNVSYAYELGVMWRELKEILEQAALDSSASGRRKEFINMSHRGLYTSKEILTIFPGDFNAADFWDLVKKGLLEIDKDGIVRPKQHEVDDEPALAETSETKPESAISLTKSQGSTV